ncbi:MAG: Holliday junction resolvase RuvX, partial [Candidatus Omnitrophica bacterium]|nr:Holliday junction resolvase RuvX [Candidatus Omnitrophota bacterium]
AVDIPVNRWDERLTTVQAERTLLEADVSRAKRKRAIDKLAATIILQNYLDSRKKG